MPAKKAPLKYHTMIRYLSSDGTDNFEDGRFSSAHVAAELQAWVDKGYELFMAQHTGVARNETGDAVAEGVMYIFKLAE